MKRIAMMTAVAVALGIPAVASANRAATKAEKGGMIYQASGRYYGGLRVSEPRSAPLRCFKADIATVVKGSRWGAWTFSSYAYQSQHAKQCKTANGVSIEHKIGTRWYVLWQGSEGYPPTHDTRSGSFVLKGVPRAVAKDLDAGLR